MRCLIAFVFLVNGVDAFVPPTDPCRLRQQSNLHMISRRRVIESAFFSASAAIISSISPAYADVADGNELPDGAQQFGRMLRIQSGIPSIKRRLGKDPSEIDKQEWTNIGGFLRRLYAEGDDMNYVGKSFSPERRKRGDELADELRKYSKAGEAPVNEQDAGAVIAILDKCNGLFKEYFDLFSDVPDEL